MVPPRGTGSGDQPGDQRGSGSHLVGLLASLWVSSQERPDRDRWSPGTQWVGLLGLPAGTGTACTHSDHPGPLQASQGHTASHTCTGWACRGTLADNSPQPGKWLGAVAVVSIRFRRKWDSPNYPGCCYP